jgi:hypothetical protein
MPRLPVHTLDSAPGNSRDQLKALEAKFGKVLNIHGEMSHSPVVLQSYVALQSVIADYGSFEAPTRERSPWLSATLTTAPTARRPTPAAGRPPG